MFFSTLIDISQTVILHDRRPMPYLGCINALLNGASSSSSFLSTLSTDLDPTWGCYNSRNTHNPTLLLSLFNHYFPSSSTMPSKNSTESTSDGSLSGMAGFRVAANHPAPISLVHNAASRRTNILPSSSSIAESNIPARCREAAAMEQQVSIGEHDIWNGPLLPDIYAAWPCFHDSEPHEICWKILLLPGSSRPTYSCTGMKSSVLVMWTAVTLIVPPLPINKVSVKSLLSWRVILSLSRAYSKLALETS